jgi:hypothetical protein
MKTRTATATKETKFMNEEKEKKKLNKIKTVKRIIPTERTC